MPSGNTSAITSHPQNKALSLASTYNYPVYDMIYAVLARRNACGVLSKDSRLAKLLVSIDVTTVP